MLAVSDRDRQNGGDGDLPDGWAAVRLRDGLVFDLQSGFACGTNKRGDVGVPHLRPMNISTTGRISLDDLKRVPDEKAKKADRWLQPGDILFNNTNSPALVGKTAVYRDAEPRAFSNHMTRLRVRREIANPDYIAAALHQHWRSGDFEQRCNHHVSQASIGREVLLETEFPLPPLAEQQRIVAAIERLTARIDAARDRLARVPKILKRFRQAVLAAACSSRLTEDWRDADASTKDMPETWRVVAAGRAYRDARYGTSTRCDRIDLGTPVLRVPNIARGVVDLSDLKFTQLSARELARLAVEEGDLIVCRTNGSLDLVGKTAVIPALDRQYAFASYLIRIRLDETIVQPRYFHAFLSSPNGRDQIEKKARTTAGQFNLNLEILRGLRIAVPPLPEQREIVRRVESLMNFANVIEHRVAAAAARADSLTQAVLAKAFRGELVPTEAEIARAEGREYETAQQLLARVRSSDAPNSTTRTPSGRTMPRRRRARKEAR